MDTLCCCIVGYLWGKCSLVLQTIEWDIRLLLMKNSQKAWKCPVQLKPSEMKEGACKESEESTEKSWVQERICPKSWWWRRGVHNRGVTCEGGQKGSVGGEIRAESRSPASPWSCCVLSRCMLPGTGSGSLDTDFKVEIMPCTENSGGKAELRFLERSPWTESRLSQMVRFPIECWCPRLWGINLAQRWS